ncbi:MAG: hypothetical protein LLG04_13505 [Parachlamydia sp.]|nr:hypothetical protein [Parachlamydia sp.]
MSQSLIVRHLLPAAVSASAAVCISHCGFYLGKAFVTGLNTLPSASLGIISGLSYSIMVETLTSKTLLKPIFIHSISILTSAVVTAGAAFAATSAGLIAMPTLASLGLLMAAAVVCNMIYRAVFTGPSHTAPPKAPQVAQLPVPADQPGPAPHQPEPIKHYPKAAIIPIAPRREIIKPWAAGAAEHPERWSWPSDLQKIGLSEPTKNYIDAFLNEVVPQIVATRQFPDFLKKGDSYYIKKNEACVVNGRSWKLPRTLYFAVDPATQQLSAILLNVSRKRVAPLGKGGQRTVKVCCNLTTGRRVVKKAACSPYEVELLKALNGTKGFEHLSQVRVTADAQGKSKARLITPLYEGSVRKLLETTSNLTAKDIKNLMVSYFNGLEKLHSIKGRTTFPDGKKYQLGYRSYHLDISPENLLYTRTSAGYDGVVTDAGTVNDIPHLWHKLIWLSPEKARQLRARRPEEENASFLAQHGQHDDMWNMGLVLTSLLTSSYFHILHQKNPTSLTQKEVDAEIARQKPIAASLTMNRNAKATMWDIARRLLQVSPEQRLTAAQALQEFKHVSA